MKSIYICKAFLLLFFHEECLPNSPLRTSPSRKLFCGYITAVTTKYSSECLFTAVCLAPNENSKKTCNWARRVSHPSSRSPLGSSGRHFTNCEALVAGRVGGEGLLQETLETNLIPKTCKMTASLCMAEVDLILSHGTLFNHGP